ncbi:MAG: type II CRISPR-associated endonuclease Cas1 [Christensenellaceae bacterium]
MWRTVVVNDSDRISIQNNWLLIEGEQVARVPLDELYSIVVDNPKTLLSVGAINAMTQQGVHIIYCNEKHLPVSVILPHNMHYRPLNVLKKQLSLKKQFKDEIWQKITCAKIENQSQVLKMCGCKRETVERLLEYSKDVRIGDVTNREGLAAKMFFREMFGSNFIRMNDDGINSALNYGYAIIRSAFAKTLASYGYNSVIGLHHISETNAFNLADDLMEPLRPIVDLWIDENNDDLDKELTRDNRRKLVNLINETVRIDNKMTKVRYAIDKYVSSLSTAIEKSSVNALKLPYICNKTLDIFYIGEEDDK